MKQSAASSPTSSPVKSARIRSIITENAKIWNDINKVYHYSK